MPAQVTSRYYLQYGDQSHAKEVSLDEFTFMLGMTEVNHRTVDSSGALKEFRGHFNEDPTKPIVGTIQ